MALNFGSVLGGAVSQLGRGDFGSRPSGVACNWGKSTPESLGAVVPGLSTDQGIKSLEDGTHSKPATEFRGMVNKVNPNDSGRMPRDSTSLPSGLSHFNLVECFVCCLHELPWKFGLINW